MFRHILFPTDGSTLSQRAAKVAVELAKSCGARLTVVHAIAPFSPPAFGEGMLPYPEIYSPEEYKRVTLKAAQAMLEKIEASAKEAGIACDSAILDAPAPWKGIVEAARTRHCDLVVMASHGRKGLEGLVLGSETHKVLTHSKTPVLVCR